MTILTACVPRGQKNSSIGIAWPFQARIRENPGRSFETGLKPNLHGDELRSLGFPTTLPTSLRMTQLESWPSLTTVVGPTTGRLGRPGSKVTSPDRPSTCRLTTARSPMSRSGEQVYASRSTRATQLPSLSRRARFGDWISRGQLPSDRARHYPSPEHGAVRPRSVVDVRPSRCSTNSSVCLRNSTLAAPTASARATCSQTTADVSSINATERLGRTARQRRRLWPRTVPRTKTQVLRQRVVLISLACVGAVARRAFSG